MTLSPLEWVGLAIALCLFLGPGYGLLSFDPDRHRYDKTQAIAISIGLSMAFWPILLAWLHGLRIALTPAGALAILVAGWALGLMHARPWIRLTHTVSTGPAPPETSRVALWVVLALTAVAGLRALQGAVAGIGSDSYHHTLIAQMIADRGILPDNFQPYAPIATFTYHFGFHGMVAAMAWLTGLPPLVLAPILGQILLAAAALSVAFFTQATTRSRSAATVSAVVAGLVSVFPAYLFNYGRDTQLAGMVILPILLGLIGQSAESDTGWTRASLIGILAAGLALTHYRVALMAASGAVVLIGWDGLMRRIGRPAWKQIGGGLILAAALAGVLIAPWVWHVLGALQQGYPIDAGKVGPAFFAVERLGTSVLNYPTNGVVIGLALTAVLVGWWRRERNVMGISIWTALMLLLSTPRFAGAFMDTVSVIISLYFPASVAIGWLIAAIVQRLAARFSLAVWAARIGLAGLSIWGALAIGAMAEPALAYVGPDDLSAMEWIRSHIPASARFMVNTYHWDFLPNYVVGSDAGYWLPLLAGRASVTAPMIYLSERATAPDFLDRLAALDRLGGQLTSPEALALLRQEGITHVYIGQRGGPISAADLASSPHFKQLYSNKTAHVFEFVGAPP